MENVSEQELLAAINELERTVPVNDIRWQGVCVWPLIRIMLVEQRNRVANVRKDDNATLNGNQSLGSIPLKLLKSWLLNPGNTLRLVQDRLARRKRPPVDIVAMSLVSGALQTVDGRHFSKFSDAVQRGSLNQSIEVEELELLLFHRGPYSRRVRPPRYYDLLMIRALLSRVDSSISGLAPIQEALENHAIFQPIAEHLLKKRLRLIEALRKGFVRHLKKIQPRCVLIGCFYCSPTFALTLAANELGINTVEIQHGKQGPFHYMYSNWHAVPPDGYALIPTHFWMWGGASRAIVNQWAERSERHTALIGGNPWLTFRVAEAKHRTQEDPFLSGLRNHSGKKVLVSIQPIDEPFPAFLLEVMRQTPHIKWLVRLHPRMLPELDDILLRLSSSGVECEVDAPSRCDLYELMEQVDLNITFWSTVAYEALVFDVPSIIVHPNGRVSMREYIDRGIFAYADTAETLLDKLEHHVFAKEEEGHSFFDARPETLRAALKEVMSCPVSDVTEPPSVQES